jgi:hypothetical protein
MTPVKKAPLDIPIVHKVNQLYKSIYILGRKVPKRDRFGLHLHIENVCLDVLELSVQAALTAKDEKKNLLEEMRVKIEVLKHLIRMSSEVGIIEDEKYLGLQKLLVEISRMAGGWLKYSS